MLKQAQSPAAKQDIKTGRHLMERSFIMPYTSWNRWKNTNREYVLRDEEKQLYIVRVGELDNSGTQPSVP